MVWTNTEKTRGTFLGEYGDMVLDGSNDYNGSAAGCWLLAACCSFGWNLDTTRPKSRKQHDQISFNSCFSLYDF